MLGWLGAASLAGCAVPGAPPPPPLPNTPAGALVGAARRQIGVTTGYDPAYRVIGYPGGDVPRTTGVCADVIVRAGRDAWRLDLQQLVHDDMAAHFAAYPHRWGLPGPDANIDHRRVPNLEAWWARHGAVLWRAPSKTVGFAFQGGPLAVGDILTWSSFVGAGAHVAIVSQIGRAPQIVQNLGWGAREDPLVIQAIAAATCHVRWRPDQTAVVG
jgi:hypothetical protein